MYNKIYITLLAFVFVAFAAVFDIFPRSTYSELEKRELAVFPEFSLYDLKNGLWQKSVSSWFSDSEPFRDELMALSMQIKDVVRLAASEDNITFHAPEPSEVKERKNDEDEETIANREVGEYHNNLTLDENAKIANAGIIIVGTGEKTRALMAYGGSSRGGLGYAAAANKYKEVFGGKVNVYCMVIPTAAEFYCPDKARKCTRPQWPTINNIHSHLAPDVKAVDIHTTLGEHAAEDIYLRTDHHWSSLGAYYAARKFAKVAGVPFRELTGYDKKVVRNFVGSMYGYSKDIAVKKAPEDFVYYVPRDVTYTVTYINYTINEHYQITGISKPVKGRFFHHYRDGHSGAYCTFMGGDTKIAQIRTSTKNGRRLIILKDSFGNAIPGFLFYSFEEIHVIDSRYFTKNMIDYVHENKITDILFANNIFNAYSSSVCRKYTRFLNQKDGVAPIPAVHAKTVTDKEEPKDTLAPHENTLSE